MAVVSGCMATAYPMVANDFPKCFHNLHGVTHFFIRLEYLIASFTGCVCVGCGSIPKKIDSQSHKLMYPVKFIYGICKLQIMNSLR